jgi:ACR3 family arsenite transporter
MKTFILAGMFTRFIGTKTKSEQWYAKRLLPRLSLLTPAFLLFTRVLMFSLKDKYIVQQPLDVMRVAILPARPEGKT